MIEWVVGVVIGGLVLCVLVVGLSCFVDWLIYCIDVVLCCVMVLNVYLFNCVLVVCLNVDEVIC